MKKRKSFFNELDRMFPVTIDYAYPMAIYLEEFGLPKISMPNGELDKDKINILSKEYLSFVIAHSILFKSKENVDVDLLNKRIVRLLNKLNKYNINSGYPKISSLDELIEVLEQSKEFYKEYYIDYMRTGEWGKSINNIALPFLELESFISDYKKVLNNESYFGIIVDKNHDVSLSSIKAVNLLIGSRINKNISMKVVVEPNKWHLYVDTNGQYIESIHDYEIVELDNSQTYYVQKIKKYVI